MKTLNELIAGYTHHLQQGEMQIAYRGIMEFLGKLKAVFIKNHPCYDVSSIYPGHMDMSYFFLEHEITEGERLESCHCIPA